MGLFHSLSVDNVIDSHVYILLRFNNWIALLLLQTINNVTIIVSNKLMEAKSLLKSQCFKCTALLQYAFSYVTEQVKQICFAYNQSLLPVQFSVLVPT